MMEQHTPNTQSADLNFAFFFHLLLTFLSWTGGLLFSWQFLLPAYILIQLQFLLLGKCVLNAKHGQAEFDDATFHSELFERAGYDVNRRKVKHFVRRWAYPLKTAFTLIWQLGLGIPPLLF